MRYFIDLFSPETARAFASSQKDVSGYRISRKTYVENQKIGPGDRFICYVTKIQRFIGVLEVQSPPYEDASPIFAKENDPFTYRFKVKPLVWLPFEKAIPIHDAAIWSALSFTKSLDKNSNQWTYMVFSSPRLWPQEDCAFLESKLNEQLLNPIEYPLTEDDQKKMRVIKIRTGDKKEVLVNVPDEIDATENPPSAEGVKEVRDSIAVQATVAEIGEKLGFKIWLPVPDRARVLKVWSPKKSETLLTELPLVFDETTLKTIKNIDVLWIRNRSIVRAFEVEDTTSIYSGILRMADLLALQPMLKIKLHIVAPNERREAVFQQVSRPVFAVMGENPLSDVCTYISYDSVADLAKEKKLPYMTDTILDVYEEYSEDAAGE
ncbi:MAG TPA: hypothetical protein DCZ92_10240 [Elusimicrobia bacterium]|nr:hypothetical protein [Elusimicrobiota bacterium]